MKDKFFLDTNIFVYSFDSTDPKKRQIAKDLIGQALHTGSGSISLQVVQEFINVAIRRFVTPLSIQDTRDYVSSVMEPICEVYSTLELIRNGLDIAERRQYSFHDSLIIAAAIESNSNLLYSEDLQHDQKILSIRIINPFLN